MSQENEENKEVFPEKKVSFYERVNIARSRFVSKKDMRGHGFNHRNAEHMLASLNLILPKCGLFLTIDNKLVEVAGTYQYEISKGNLVEVTGKVYHQIKVELLDMAEGSNKKITANNHACEPPKLGATSLAQVSGATYSYALKYALQALMSVSDGSIDPDFTQHK